MAECKTLWAVCIVQKSIIELKFCPLYTTKHEPPHVLSALYGVKIYFASGNFFFAVADCVAFYATGAAFCHGALLIVGRSLGRQNVSGWCGGDCLQRGCWGACSALVGLKPRPTGVVW